MKKINSNVHIPPKDEYLKYTVENFILLITQKNLQKDKLIVSIKKIDADEELILKALQKIDFAYKRISTPLEKDIKYLLLIFPFGVVNKFNPKGFFSVEENKRLGFVKKVKEYIMYSFIGLTLYAIFITLAVIFL